MKKRGARKTLKHYFVPHEGNEHRPHILRPRSVLFFLIVALVMEGAFVFGTTQLAPRSGLFGIIVANSLVDETNQSRVTNGDTALTVEPLLTAAAQEKANDMVTNNYFAHTSPAGVTPWYWFERVGYGFNFAGENLAVDFSDSQDVTNAWMNSPEHRANILDSDYTQIGIATATGTYEGHAATYVVELFGTPVPPAPLAEPIAFVNSAAAAGNSADGGGVSAPTAKPTTPKPAVTKPIGVKPVPKATSTVIGAAATTSLQSATSGLTIATINGSATQTASATVPTITASATTTTSTATSVVPAIVGATAPTVASQANPIQQAAANPRALIDDIYLAIIALFALALGINVFVKIRIQHPQCIFGGMLVILAAGLLIVANQHLLGGAAVL